MEVRRIEGDDRADRGLRSGFKIIPRVFAIAALVVVIGLAVGTARSLHTDERLARIETGLLLPINWKGEPRATMPLRDRMAHYQAPGVSLAVLDKGGLAAVRGWGVARPADPGRDCCCG